MGIFSLNFNKNSFSSPHNYLNSMGNPYSVKVLDDEPAYPIESEEPISPDVPEEEHILPSDVARAYFMTAPFSFNSKEHVTTKCDKSGNVLFKCITKGSSSKIQTADGITLYSKMKKGNHYFETVYSMTGKKLFEIKTQKNGASVKTIFNDDGETIKSIITYSPKGEVIKKEVLSSQDTSLLQEEAKTPKYFYHFTSLENYQSMLKDGVIKTTTDKLLAREGNRGSFMVDSNNLLNGWATLEKGDEASSLVKLLKFSDKEKTNKIVMLKIYASKLQKNDIVFRVQSEVLNSFPVFDLPDKQQESYFAFEDLFDSCTDDLPHKRNIEILDSIFMPDRAKQLSQGIPLTNIDEYQNDSIEYIYKGDIPVDCISDAKIVDISKLEGMSYFESETEEVAKEILSSVL